VERLWAVGVTAVAAGDYHSAALTVDGRLFTWGRGKYGALGLGDLQSCSTPSEVRALEHSTVTQLVAGADHTAALCAGGRAYAWGQGTWGQTGLDGADNVCQPLPMCGVEGVEIVQVCLGRG